MSHRMILNETSYFGAGARAELVGEVKRRGYKKALVVTDAVLVKAGTVAKVTSLMDAAGLAYELFDKVMPNPTIGVVKEGFGHPQSEKVVDELRRFGPGSADSLIFASSRRPDVAYSSEYVWQAALTAANVKDFRFHDLRHTCASYLAQNGATLLEIGEILGVSESRVCQIHGQLKKTLRTMLDDDAPLFQAVA